MKITPKEGDYVRAEWRSIDQYHEVAKAFIDAGCDAAEYPFESWDHWIFVGWKPGYGFSHQDMNRFDGRELSLSDLLGKEVSEPRPKDLRDEFAIASIPILLASLGRGQDLHIPEFFEDLFKCADEAMKAREVKP